MSGIGRLNPQRQVFASQGEATPAADLPTKFVSMNQPASPIKDHLSPPSGYIAVGHNSAYVDRHPRMVGMRYLYAGGHQNMPIQRLGADGPPNPWISAYQRMLHGPIHNAGFNDALYQAGYGGFNLQTSFKVPTLPQNRVVPTRGFQKTFNITQKMIRVRRATGQPKGT